MGTETIDGPFQLADVMVDMLSDKKGDFMRNVEALLARLYVVKWRHVFPIQERPCGPQVPLPFFRSFVQKV